MTVVAAPGDTWGIPGPTFVLIFVGAAGALILATMLHRLFLFAGRRDLRPEQLTPEQVAHLNGGDRVAVYAALGALRAAGAVGTGPGGTLAATGPTPATMTPLERAVRHAAQNGIRARQLHAHPSVTAAVSELRDGLERAGLAPTRGQRRTGLLVPLLMLGLAALGVLRLVAGMRADKPIGALAVLLFLFVPMTLFMLFGVPRQTRAARAALRALRARHKHLAPASSPAYATYGATGVAMGVALYGTASLWAMDPAFAAEAELRRNVDANGGSSASSCGGGGSCGGGSSCGSGCGGGGCGG